MTTDTTPDLSDLLDRVRSATGPSREIDQDIFCAFGLAPVSDDGIADENHSDPTWGDQETAEAISFARRARDLVAKVEGKS